MKYLSFLRSSLLGLDIQNGEIKLIKLRKSYKTYWVEYLGGTKVPEQVFLDGKIKRWEILSDILNELVRELGIKNTATAIQISADLVSMQSLQLPQWIAHQKLESEIYDYIKLRFPEFQGQLCMDYMKIAERNNHYWDIHFTAAKKDYITKYVTGVNTAGLAVKAVDVDLFALKRAIYLDDRLKFSTMQTVAILHLVNCQTLLVVFMGKKIIHRQQWKINQIADILNQIQNAIKLLLASAEISIQCFILCGDVSYTKFIQNHEYFAELFEIHVVDISPCLKFVYREHETLFKKKFSEFMIAIGLAVRAFVS